MTSIKKSHARIFRIGFNKLWKSQAWHTRTGRTHWLEEHSWCCQPTPVKSSYWGPIYTYTYHILLYHISITHTHMYLNTYTVYDHIHNPNIYSANMWEYNIIYICVCIHYVIHVCFSHYIYVDILFIYIYLYIYIYTQYIYNVYIYIYCKPTILVTTSGTSRLRGRTRTSVWSWAA